MEIQSYFIARGKKTRSGEDTGTTPWAGANLEGATHVSYKVHEYTRVVV